MSNDFLPWAIGASANVEAQASYAVDANLSGGYPAGVQFPSTIYNKTMRQATFVASALAQFIADNLNSNVVDSGNIAAFEGQLRSAIGYASGTQVWSISTTSFDHYTPVNLHGSTSGVITLNPQAVAGTYSWNYPSTAGSSGQVLASGGGGTNQMTWLTPTGTGAVVLSASPTFTGLVTHSGMRTGTRNVNNGSALTSGFAYPAMTTPIPSGTIGLFAKSSVAGGSGGCFLTSDSASGTLIIGDQWGSGMTFAVSGSNITITVTTTGAIVTTYWTVLAD